MATPAFLLLSVLILVLDGWESPVRKVLLLCRGADRPQRVRIAAYNRSVYNVAFAVGSLLGDRARCSTEPGCTWWCWSTHCSFLLAAALALPVAPAGQGQPTGQGCAR